MVRVMITDHVPDIAHPIEYSDVNVTLSVLVRSWQENSATQAIKIMAQENLKSLTANEIMLGGDVFEHIIATFTVRASFLVFRDLSEAINYGRANWLGLRVHNDADEVGYMIFEKVSAEQ
jgi:hypothetical protein